MKVNIPSFPMDVYVRENTIEVVTRTINAETGYPGSFSFEFTRRGEHTLEIDIITAMVRAFQHEVLETLTIDGVKPFRSPHGYETAE